MPDDAKKAKYGHKKYAIGQVVEGKTPPPGKWQQLTPGPKTEKTRWKRVG